METIRTSDGWVCIQYPTDEAFLMSDIGYGTEWFPALLDTVDGVVVAKVRRTKLGRPGIVVLRVNGRIKGTYKFIDN